jgi:hypothetical protein
MESEHTSGAKVQVESLVTGESATFRMSFEATLKATWDEAYKKLDEARRDGDTFQCGGAAEGTSLMSSLDLTLRQVVEQNVCGQGKGKEFEFEIKGPSGGAFGHVGV